MGRTIRNKNKRDKKRLKEYRKSRQKRSLYYHDTRNQDTYNNDSRKK